MCTEACLGDPCMPVCSRFRKLHLFHSSDFPDLGPSLSSLYLSDLCTLVLFLIVMWVHELSSCVCMCLSVYESTRVRMSQCMCGGQRIASGLVPHFSPCLGQLLTRCCVYQVSSLRTSFQGVLSLCLSLYGRNPGVTDAGFSVYCHVGLEIQPQVLRLRG